MIDTKQFHIHIYKISKTKMDLIKKEKLTEEDEQQIHEAYLMLFILWKSEMTFSRVLQAHKIESEFAEIATKQLDDCLDKIKNGGTIVEKDLLPRMRVFELAGMSGHQVMLETSFKMALESIATPLLNFGGFLEKKNYKAIHLLLRQLGEIYGIEN